MTGGAGVLLLLGSSGVFWCSITQKNTRSGGSRSRSRGSEGPALHAMGTHTMTHTTPLALASGACTVLSAALRGGLQRHYMCRG